MNRAVGTYAKGIATGIAVGAAVGMLGSSNNMRKRLHMKKNAAKAVRAIGELAQNVQYMFK